MALPENNNQAEKVLKSLDEQHSKYKFMEMNMIARKRRLRQQLPDLQKSLEMIKILNDQEEDELETNILLSEQVFVKSVIQKTQTVCLWLGANVMLEYPLDEAEELLKSNLDSASMNLRCLEHDQVRDVNKFSSISPNSNNGWKFQEFLRNQQTTVEVAMARIYNWDITRRKAQKWSNPTSMLRQPSATALSTPQQFFSFS